MKKVSFPYRYEGNGPHFLNEPEYSALAVWRVRNEKENREWELSLQMLPEKKLVLKGDIPTKEEIDSVIDDSKFSMSELVMMLTEFAEKEEL